MDVISLDEKFGLIDEHWRPKLVASLNGQEVKLVKCQGVFPWHHHEDEDELFLVWNGTFKVEYRDRNRIPEDVRDRIVELKQGEMHVVPRGIEHRTLADEVCEVIIFEPAATRNTGNVVDEAFTAPNGVTV